MRLPPTSRIIATLALLGAAVPGAVASASAGPDIEGNSVARATVRSVNGTVLGTVRLDASNRKIAVSGRLTGLSAGFHGFHIHAVGICNPTATDPTGAVVPFFTAGGHLNPTATGHGNHAGDLPSLYVSADGTTTSVTEKDTLTAATLFDTDGSAIIIHALPDNFANIPTRYSATGPDAATLATGDSGGRIACGVLSRN
jgi:Cu-Zn family superoxide dismutase